MNKIDFNIKFENSDNKFYIIPKKSHNDVKVEVVGFSNSVIYTTTFNFEKGISYWIQINPNNEIGLILKFHSNQYSFEEKVRLRTLYGEKIKQFASEKQ